MSLYVRHRPKELGQVLGNVATLKKVQSWLGNKKRSHSILLTGPSGCGKTTVARIIASELGCTGGDYSEMDTADFRGIDTIRELRSRINFLPMESSCRVFLLDECHKLTNDAQNALLKALEEPPEHVYMILATTNPEKLIQTIKTRCTPFTFNILNDADMSRLILRTCKREKVELEKATIQAIIERSVGSPRHALSILEQIIKLDDPNVDITSADQEEKQVIDLCRALMRKRPWNEIRELIKSIEADPESIRQAVLGYCSACLLNGDQKAYLIMEPFLVNTFYDAGKARLVACCYEALLAE